MYCYEDNALKPRTSSTDDLTGLLDRISVVDQLKLTKSNSEQLVMAVEISRFGNVNSSMGTELGDKVISMIAKRLGKTFPNASAIARTNGDHFVLVFEKLPNHPEEIARLQDFTQRPLIIRGEVIVLSIRVGVARRIDIDSSNSTGLLHAAETALHSAKKSSSKVCYYTRALELEAIKSHRLENDLRVSLVTNAAELHRAISNSEFELVYQPVIGTWSNKVHAFEALLRWNHPVHGVVSPAVFIPLAEQISIMDILGTWVIRKACSDAVSWPQNSDGSLPSVSINVSPTQFIEPGILIHAVHMAIEETGIEPTRINLEITESAAFSDRMSETLHKIRSLGCTIALDDFGTGYSSLTQLHTLPLDYIKIDRSFIRNLCSENPVEDKRCEKLTRGILVLADTLSLIPIVEGIETECQLTRIRQLGANLIQGFIYSKPLKLSELPDFIKLHQ